MSERKRLFLNIFKAELEDCLEDVDDLANLYKRRHGKHEVTDYVFNENEALLNRELSGIQKTIKALDTINIDQFNTVEDLASAIDTMIQQNILEYDDPEAVYMIAKRKLLKVLRYVTESSL